MRHYYHQPYATRLPNRGDDALESAAVMIVGVLDLLAGRAVHAQGGRRDGYAPVENVAGRSIEPVGDVTALAATYMSLGMDGLYVADLDAIEGRPLQERAIGALTKLGAPLWLDAGASSVDAARRHIELEATTVIVGSETFSSFESLQNICGALGGRRVAFSLDLLNGKPLAKNLAVGSCAPRSITARVVEAGVGTVIVLDLGRVGRSVGPDVDLIAAVRAAASSVTLLVGGGIRGLHDLRRLADTGCDGALVATAVHDGRLTAHDIAIARVLGPARLGGKSS